MFSLFQAFLVTNLLSVLQVRMLRGRGSIRDTIEELEGEEELADDRSSYTGSGMLADDPALSTGPYADFRRCCACCHAVHTEAYLGELTQGRSRL